MRVGGREKRHTRETTMQTPYDVLGVPRKASDETIRAAFRKTAKACHPDLNAGDRTAEQQLRLAIASYNILKSPQQRTAYNRYLRDHRRQRVRRFAMAVGAGLLSGTIAALVVWLSVSLSNTQEASGPPQTPRIAAAEAGQGAGQQVAAADDGVHQDGDGGRQSDSGATAPKRLIDDWPRHLQQSASSLHPTAGPAKPQSRLAREWEQVQVSGDPRAIWAFAVRNPDAPESELVRSKLMELIDAADDVSLLSVLRLVAADAIAERAQQRLTRLGALAVAEEDSAPAIAEEDSAPAVAEGDRVATRAPPSDSLEARAADFVSSQVSAWSSTNPINLAILASSYADEVFYYGSRKSRQAVLLDKRRLLERWPERIYGVQSGSITVQCLANMCTVGGMIDWQTRSVPRAASASGIAQFEYKVTLSPGAFSIVSENSSVVKR
jgi:curved DNA-binding protein CbpA